MGAITMNGDIHFLIRRHMPEVLEIENASFSVPWTYDEMWEACWGETAKNEPMHMALVYIVRDEVAGYAVYHLDDEKIEILNLAIREDFRRQGIASELISSIKIKLEGSKVARTHMIADVSEQNLEAQPLFKKNGFMATQVVHDAYGDWSSDDCYRFEWLAFESALWHTGETSLP